MKCDLKYHNPIYCHFINYVNIDTYGRYMQWLCNLAALFMQIMWVVLNVLRFPNKSLCAGASTEMQKYVLHVLLTFSTFNWVKFVLGMQLGRRELNMLKELHQVFLQNECIALK